jgi:HSP20 family protein
MLFEIKEAKLIHLKTFDMSIVKFKHYPAKSFNNLVSDFLVDFPSLYREHDATNLGQSAPVNIKENEEGYKLEIIAPGFKKEDFKIHLEKNLLSISVERKAEEETKNEKQIKKEYEFKTVKRTFTIDEKIDTEKIEAKYDSGVLIVNLAKKAEVKAPTKQITIQ